MYRGVCDISEARSQKRKGPSCRSSQSVGICVGHSRLRGLDLEVVILGSQSTDQAMELVKNFEANGVVFLISRNGQGLVRKKSSLGFGNLG